jgi:hypothetical protein
MFGVGRNSHERAYYGHHHYRQRVWVPDYILVRRWVPAHWEYDPRYGQVFVKGHYITYQQENGGHWEYR